MAMTIIEKILSAHSGGDPVVPGRIVTCDVDRVVMLDLQFAGGPEPLRVHDPARVSVVLDHAAPALPPELIAIIADGGLLVRLERGGYVKAGRRD